MKKILLLFVLFAANSQAQVLDKNVYFGLLITGNGTQLNAGPSIGKITPDYGFGASAFLRLRKRFVYFEAEVGYAQHKIIVSPDIAGSTVISNYSLSGLDLSAMLGWRVVGIGKLGNFRIFTGINYGRYSDVSIESNSAQVNDSSIETSNTGVIGGLGVDLWKIVFNIKYIHGISNISNTKDQSTKSQYVSVSLGYKF